MYRKYVKRFMDFVLSICALIILSPLLIILIIIGVIVMKGNPFFMQQRPGKVDKYTGQEKIFKLIKFRTMSNDKDDQGNLLPDDSRINAYGKFLRSTSLDELPEILNILSGSLSFVGPRPQLVKDMVFMTPNQRKRHTVRQGLTGLAQISGRNNISWEEKFEIDLEYIDNITFIGDIKIVLKTVVKVLSRSDTVREGTVSDVNFGDYLLSIGRISNDEYEKGQVLATELINMM